MGFDVLISVAIVVLILRDYLINFVDKIPLFKRRRAQICKTRGVLRPSSDSCTNLSLCIQYDMTSEKKHSQVPP